MLLSNRLLLSLGSRRQFMHGRSRDRIILAGTKPKQRALTVRKFPDELRMAVQQDALTTAYT
jgi:hypothetical protein